MITPTTLELEVLASGVRSALGAPQAGPMVGRFRLVRLLGAGGYGQVYEAVDSTLDRRVALKLLPAANPGHAARSAELVAEGRAMARVDNEHVVRVYEVGSWNARLFVAMQLIEGDTLRSWAQALPRTVAEKLDVLLTVTRGLAAIHASGLVHLDVKPENIIVDAAGVAKVADFGLARLVSPRSREPTGASSPRDIVRGTPGYVAPEVAGGSEANASADQYGFAVTAYELLYGDLPPAGTRAASSGTKGRGDVPRAIAAVLERALAPIPHDRWPSMNDLAAALERGRSRRRHRAWITAGVVGLGLVVSPIGRDRFEPIRRTANCERATAALAQTLAADSLDEIRLAFRATTLPAAIGAEASTLSRLHQAREEARIAVARACAATRDELTDHAFDSAIQCGIRRAQRLRLVEEQLASARGRLVDRAVDAVAMLRASDCDGIEGKPRVAASMADFVGAGLFRIDLALELGDYAAANRTLSELMAEPQPAALAAEIGLRRGVVARRLGHASQAHEHLIAALHDATRRHDDPLALRVAIELVALCARDLAHVEEARTHATYARALAQSLPFDARSMVELAEETAYLHTVSGEYREARALLGDAIEQLEGLPDQQGVLADMLIDYADASNHQQDHTEAATAQRRALTLLERTFGRAHPRSVTALMKLGHTHRLQNDYAAAIGFLHRASTLAEQTSNGSAIHPDLPEIHGLLTACHHRLGQSELAAAAASKAEEAAVRLHGDHHPVVAQALARRAVLVAADGDVDAACELHRRALRMLEETTPVHDPRRAVMMLTAASVERQAGHVETALELAVQARRAAERLHGHEHISLVQYLLTEHRLHVDAGREKDAATVGARAQGLAQMRFNRVIVRDDATASDLHEVFARLSNVFHRTGSPELVVAAHERAADVLAQVVPPREDLVWVHRASFAYALLNAGRCADAIPIIDTLVQSRDAVDPLVGTWAPSISELIALAESC